MNVFIGPIFFHLGNKQASTLHSYNRHLFTKHYPVYMSQQTFFRMLFTPDGRQWSKLESFLASSALIKQFVRAASEPTDPNNPTVRKTIFSHCIINCSIQFRFDPFRMNKIPIVSNICHYKWLSYSIIILPLIEYNLFRLWILPLKHLISVG